LHPKREPLDTLDGIRRTIGVAGQYQQSPVPWAVVWSKLNGYTLSPERAAGAIRSHRAKLGLRGQSDRAKRFLGVHDLGHQGRAPLSARRVPQATRISRAQTSSSTCSKRASCRSRTRPQAPS
jgi:hypothetical protein